MAGPQCGGHGDMVKWLERMEEKQDQILILAERVTALEVGVRMAKWMVGTTLTVLGLAIAGAAAVVGVVWK